MIWVELALAAFTAFCLIRAFEVGPIGVEIHREQMILKRTGQMIRDRYYAVPVVVRSLPRVRIPKRVALKIVGIADRKFP